MVPSIYTRMFVPGDEYALATLIEQTVLRSNAADYPAEQLNDLVLWHRPQRIAQRAPLVTIVVAATLDGTVVGTLTRHHDRLEAFFVHPDWQGCGVGTLLLDDIEHDAVEHGITMLYLDASVTAEQFYRHRGYHPTALPQDGPFGRTIPMARNFLSVD